MMAPVVAEKLVGVCDALSFRQGRDDGRRKAVDLVSVEDGIRPRERSMRGAFVRFGLRLLAGFVEEFPENHDRGLLAFPDLRVFLIPLLVSSPVWRGVTFVLRGREKHHWVDASVKLACHGVGGHPGVGVPWALSR
jgi:hypothetical protein